MDKITETKELARYIEKLRSLRNISQEDFVDGVVSLRQYRRYMQGTSAIQMKIIKQLAEKLSFKPVYILLEFESEKLTQYINQQLTVVSGHNVRTVVLVLQQLSKYYGMIEDYHKVLEFTNSAIDYSIKMKSMYSLDYLFYYQALANYKLSNISNYESALYRCFCILQTESNHSKTEKFITMIKKSFKINF